jgi:hypothetical protein
MTVSWMLWYLWRLIEETESLDTGEEEFGYDINWVERKKKKKPIEQKI